MNLKSSYAKTLPAFITLLLVALGFVLVSPLGGYAADGALPVGTPIVVSHTEGGLEVTVRTTDGTNRPAEANTYTYYTGEEATTQIEISNRDNQLNDYTVRVYMRFDSDGYRLPYTLGPQSVTTAGKTYNFTFNQADEANVYYLEFPKPGIGDTATVPALTTYPSPGTPGGKAEIWATVMSPADATAIGAGVTEKGDWEQLDWTTVPDLFPAEKKRASTEVYLLGDGTGGNDYVRGLVYDVDLQRGGETLEGMGKDYVKNVTYTDTLQIDQRFAWDADVLDAIRNGGYTVRYDSLDEDLGINTNNVTHDPIVALISVGDKRVASIWHGTNDVRWTRNENFRLTVDDNNQIVISWSEPNASIANNPTQPGNWTEMTNTHTQIYIGNQVLEYTGDATDPDLITTGVQITNKIAVTEEYCYSEDKTYESQVEDTVRAREANLKLNKSMPYYITRGEEFAQPVRIWVRNTGSVPYTQLYKVNDILPSEFYMTPEAMFEHLSSTEHPDARKEIELTQANLYNLPTTTQATDYHGETDYGLNTENTADDNLYWGSPLEETGLRRTCTLHLYKDGDVYRCAVNGSITDEDSFTFIDAASLEQGLESIGYAPTRSTRYEVMWLYDPKPAIQSDEMLEYTFRAWAKDSFQAAQGDQLHHINLEEGLRYNYAYAYKQDGTRIGSDFDITNIKQDATITKGGRLVQDGTVDDEDLPEDTNLDDDSVVEYAVAVTHAGSKQYDTIPLVDSMQGIQMALVRKDLNPHLASEGLGSYTISGTEYYMLNKVGTFEDVWFGEPEDKHLADHVVITHSDEGFSTISYYYLDDYAGDEITRYIRYRALVSIDESNAAEASYYRVDNCGYLNDHQGHRILAPVGYGVSPIYFDKRVIDERGTTPQSDVNVADFSYFHKGEKTIYRLVLGHNNAPTGQYVEVTGQEIWDQLPETVTGLTWQKGDGTHAGDVQIDIYEDPGNVEWTNPDSWSIVSDTHDQGNTNPNQQYIQWGDDFKVRFWDRAVMYVTLTMPDGDVWNNYAATFMNQRLRNTFHYHEYQSYVQHELSEPIQAYLEKSVYATGDKKTKGRDTDQRFWYANDMYVYYTVSLVNMGDIRLYVNDFQDKLPTGFHMEQASSNVEDSQYSGAPTSIEIGPSVASSSSGIYCPENAYALRYIDGVAQTRGAYVPKHAQLDWSTETKADGHEYITFKISQSSSTSRIGNDIKYDEYYQKCYLDPGEMIEFGYWAKVDSALESTADTADNTIVMPVSDYAGAGVKVEEADVRTHEHDNADSNEGTCDHDADFNPTRNDRVENLGFEGEDTDTWWLKSDVTVRRGLIVPGITKSVYSTIDAQGVETTNPVVARTSDTIRYRVNAGNGGNQVMPTYVLQDTIPAPYKFTGPITLTFNNVLGSGTATPEYQASLNIIDRTHHLGADRLTVQYQTSRSGLTRTFMLVADGEPVQVELYLLNLTQNYSNWDTRAKAWVSLETETDGSETIKFQFDDGSVALEPLETVTMDLRVNNPSGTPVQDKLVNNCFITPLNRTFLPDDVTQGNNTTASDVDGNALPAVRNSVPIPFAGSYQTTSYKKVEQLDDPDNWGLSYLPDRNWINLPSKSTLFAFTDYVFFATEQPIQDFIIIDNLPEVGDHMTYENSTPRDSKFEVSLYSDPQFEIVVTHADGSETVLDSSQYTIDFADHTEFSNDDWRLNPQDPDPWYSTPKDSTRSFRVRVLDPDATLITPESTISIRYVCEITDEALDDIAGLISWNSFGYRYLVDGGQTYLEAAPLKVGIRFPLPPSVKKNVVDSDGDPFELGQDTTFRFLTFKGSADDIGLDLTRAYTDAGLAAALEAAGVDYAVVDAPVAAGQSSSETIQMDPEDGFVKWTYADGEFKKQEGPDAAWTWEQGASYTTVELPSSLGEDFSESRFYEGLPYETWEFTWRHDIVIECENRFETWEINLNKSFQLLDGTWTMPDRDPSNYAIFGLYSTEPADEMAADAIAARAAELGLSEVPAGQTQSNDPDGGPDADKTFYLTALDRVDTSASGGSYGTLRWDKLSGSSYLVRELQAPDKFILNGDKEVYREDSYEGIYSLYLTNSDVWSIEVRKAAHEAPQDRIFPAGFALYGIEGQSTLTEEEFETEWTQFESAHSAAAGNKPPYSISYTLPDGTEQTLYAVGLSATYRIPYQWSATGYRDANAWFPNLQGEYYVLREFFGPEGYALADDKLIARDKDFEGADYIYGSAVATVTDKAYWSIGITKNDEAAPDALLADAVFGVYLDDESMTQEEIDAAVGEFGLDAAPKAEIEYQGKTYTLARIGKTTADGPLTFEDLTSDYAIAVELKAPEGYFLDDSQIVFSKVADEDASTIDAEVVDSHEATSVYVDSWSGDEPYTYMVYDRHASATVENHITKTCQLAIGATKSLTGRNLAEGEFSFELLDAKGVVLQTKTADADGKISFDPLSFDEYDMDEELAYAIREVKPAEPAPGVAYDDHSETVKVDLSLDDEGALTATAVYDEDGAVFENAYTAQGSIVLAATKKLEGAALEDGRFAFELANEAGDILQTKTNNAGGGVVFDAISFTQDDLKNEDGSYAAQKTFTYTISEVDDGQPGTTYETEPVTATVTVADKGDGTLDVTASYDPADALFTNVYGATGSVALHATKTLQGHALEAGQFSFQLKDAEGAVLQTKTNAADGSVLFDELTYTVADVANSPVRYTIGELNGGMPGYTYDSTVAEVSVELVDNGDGTITATPTYAGNEGTFANSYAAEGSVSFKATKLLEGRKLEDAQFSFQLKDAGGTVLQTKTNDADGSVAFDAISYTQNDLQAADGSFLPEAVFDYVVSEVLGAASGYTYDAREVAIKVTVKDNGDGTLDIAASSSAEGIEFANSYAASGEAEITGTKALSGAQLTDGQFSFQLIDEAGNVAQEAVNAGGSFTFKLAYTHDDLADGNGAFLPEKTFAYTVREVNDGQKGIVYDESTFAVNVTVKDNGDGTLDVAARSDSGDIAFANAYEAAGSARLSATKTLTGAALAAGRFQFQLKDEAGTVLQTKANGADGAVRFDDLPYTLADVARSPIHYTISEVDDKQGGVTYDTSVIEADVSLVDNGDGTITATPTYAGSTVFSNVYAASGSVGIVATKTLAGRDLEAGQFSFQLKDGEGNVLQTKTNAADGTVMFDGIRYTIDDLSNGDGTYAASKDFKYKVSEVNDAKANVTYDETVHDLVVTVSDKGDGTLEATLGSGSGAISFTNVYNEPRKDDEGKTEMQGAAFTPLANKTLTGPAGLVLREGEFTFVLVDESGNVVQTKANAADGSVVFDALAFSEAGTFVYTISEVTEGTTEFEGSLYEGGVRYDTHACTLTVTVAPNDAGDALVATAVYSDDDAASFNNEYSRDWISIDGNDSHPETSGRDEEQGGSQPSSDDEPKPSGSEESSEASSSSSSGRGSSSYTLPVSSTRQASPSATAATTARTSTSTTTAKTADGVGCVVQVAAVLALCFCAAAAASLRRMRKDQESPIDK